jgi:uncharacterized membrane protein YccF (DUF307 family)
MRKIANILWHFPFFGFISASIAYVIGLLLVALVITAPLGLGLMEIGKMLFAPYTRELVDEKLLKSYQAREPNQLWEKYKIVVKVLWLIPGFFLFLATFFQGLFLCITIIGIPVGIVAIKTSIAYLNPIGKKCVDKVISDELDRRQAQEKIQAAI